MTRGFDYLSVFSPNEIWGKEKPDYCRSLIRPGQDLDTLEYAKTRLELYKQFDPAIPHNRTVAQIVTMNTLNNPRWEKKGKLLAANIDILREDEGLEEQVEIDFGKKAEQISEGIKPESVQNCDFEYDPECFGKHGIALMKIRFLPCTYAKPVIFSVLDYVAVDGEMIQEDRKIHRPTFDEKIRDFLKYVKNADNHR